MIGIPVPGDLDRLESSAARTWARIGGCVLEGMICPRCAYECDRSEPTCSHCGCRLPRTGDPTDSSVGDCDSAAMSVDGDPFTCPQSRPWSESLGQGLSNLRLATGSSLGVQARARSRTYVGAISHGIMPRYM